MSIWRIPCLALAMIGMQVTMTPPHPPPLKGEEAPSTSWEFLVKQRCCPVFVKSMCWFAALAEWLVIFSTYTRSVGISQTLLSVLDSRGRVDHIHASPMFVMGTLLATFGGFIRYACYRELGRLFTFEMSIRKEHRLVTTGPYALVRHPGYTGVVCTVMGIAILHLAPGSWANECGILSTKLGKFAMILYLGVTGLVTVGLLKRMEKEDVALREIFKHGWDEWAKKVPWRLFPGIY
ncbi:hypothetical protein Moror_8980 [Moniliophthora roreri MCA 2997]|uniref:Protein-S-isoprenylcysteine O-methyltransferase n=2 Tax=Moniliophthora roreri TaxID=221103 RepID=V2XGY1_MONRO|nr:hypothetical protein Moror_8980 [Moniliophthora roreri MCA 2997]